MHREEGCCCCWGLGPAVPRQLPFPGVGTSGVVSLEAVGRWAPTLVGQTVQGKARKCKRKRASVARALT
jgi:hypothetical protein